MSEQNYCYQCCLFDICKHIDRGTHTLASPACDAFDPGMRWIPVTERLPEENEKVLIYARVGIITVGWYTELHGCNYDKGFETECGFMWLETVPYWMPLPDAPKE